MMPPIRIRGNPQQFEEDSNVVTALSMESLSEDEREQARILAEGMKALLLKGLFHRVRPDEFPISNDSDALESRTAAAIGSIDPHRFSRMRPKIESLLSNPTQIAEHLGSIAHLNLRKPSVDLELERLSSVFKLRESSGSPQINLLPQPTFSRLTLILRKIHCVDETNPEGGDDDIILGGIRVGASGNIAVIDAFPTGHFDDGDFQDFGAIPLGNYSLKTTPGYPKAFYCIFLLVESDSDDEEVAKSLTSALGVIANIAAGIAGGPSVVAIVQAIFSVIGAFLDVLIDDDFFPPYGIQLKLNSQNHFGSAGTGPNQHTGNIKAHGGTYRIGFRWDLTP